MKMVVSLLCAAAVFSISSAHADGHSRKHPVRYYASPHQEDRDREHCVGQVRGVGTQWIGPEGALDAARKDWAERTRYDYGESYIDMVNAKDFRKRCGRVSIGEIAGQVMYRCEVIAVPCKAEMKPSGETKR